VQIVKDFVSGPSFRVQISYDALSFLEHDTIKPSNGAKKCDSFIIKLISLQLPLIVEAFFQISKKLAANSKPLSEKELLSSSLHSFTSSISKGCFFERCSFSCRCSSSRYYRRDGLAVPLKVCRFSREG